MTPLYSSAPDFDQPLAVLKHCHGRIRKQLDTLIKLGPYLSAHGADVQAQQAADAIARYFTQAAPLHHDDEEINLMPMLKDSARDDDARLLDNLIPQILQDHQKMTALWNSLAPQLAAVSEGHANQLSANDVSEFSHMYAQHMEAEETHIAPMAMRLFSPLQMHELGTAMQKRRGISFSK